MKSVVFLTSGGGGNLRFFHSAGARGLAPDFEIRAVIADRTCGALDFATRHHLEHHLVAYNRAAPEGLRRLLLDLAPDIIVSNFNKVLDAEIVEAHAGKIINLHYSLLPAFAGLIGDEPLKAALAAGCKIVGTTTHYVDVTVDGGRIIGQSTLAVREGEGLPPLLNATFRAGCLNLLNALWEVVQHPPATQLDTVSTLQRTLNFVPPLRFEAQRLPETFWEDVGRS
jgi:phosphoribosylglycinamide formyltransferase 1